MDQNLHNQEWLILNKSMRFCGPGVFVYVARAGDGLWDTWIPLSKRFSAILRPPPVTQPPSTAPRTTQAPEFLGAVDCSGTVLEDGQLQKR